MRIRLVAAAALAGLAVAGLTACGGSGGGSSTAPTSAAASQPAVAATTPAGNSAPATSAAAAAPTAAGTANAAASGADAAFCAKLVTASDKLSGLAPDMSDPAKLKDALGEVTEYYEELSDSAPAAVKPAIDDLLTAMKAAEKAFSDPSNVDTSALAGLGSKLATDAQTLGTYISTNCTS